MALLPIWRPAACPATVNVSAWPVLPQLLGRETAKVLVKFWVVLAQATPATATASERMPKKKLLVVPL
ncbi:MAG: hypothetical protein ACRDNS_07505, partial [Trebonia sp.]